MCWLHHVLESRLAPVVAAAEFVLVDSSGSGTADVSADTWLEYRATYADRWVLLDIYRVAVRQTVSATLWSPAALARAVPDAEVHTIAIRERSWHYDASADRDALADEIVVEVVAWLEQAPWEGTPT